MRTHSPLVVDVHELLEAHGLRRSVALTAPVEGLEVGLVGARDELRFDLILESIDGGILVQGSISGRYAGKCRRCVGELARAFELGVAEVYRSPGEVWEEGYVITNATIDLERIARDTVALNLPVNPLCRPDCAGLCPRCGADLNEGPCGCPALETDLRWSALRELLGPTDSPTD